jgi:membrane-bound lytic murein transglycosylase D
MLSEMKYTKYFSMSGLILLILFLSTPNPGLAQSWAGSANESRYLPPTPDKLSLCGEAVPLDQAFVAEQLDREFNIAVNDQGQVVMWLKRAHRYFPYISKQLKKAGLPDDLKYLAVAESALLPKVRSHAGAVGLWQFIRGTGRRYKLRRNRYFDDRHNPEKATRAAVAYLRDLHKEFGNWALAMAAYNCGERRVKNAIKEQGTKNYYHLYLPRETMRYVFRIMAAKLIIQNPERYGYNLPKSQLYEPLPTQNVTVALRRTTHLRNVAKAASTSIRIIRELNPEIRGMTIPKGTYDIKIPKGTDFSFPLKIKSKAIKLSQAGKGSGKTKAGSQANRRYVVRRGDTLSKIAKKNRVSIRELKRANRIKGSIIKPGQKLIIP